MERHRGRQRGRGISRCTLFRRSGGRFVGAGECCMILIFPMYQVLIFVCKKLFFGKQGDIDLPTVSGNLNSFARVCLSLSLSLSLCLSLSLSLSLARALSLYVYTHIIICTYINTARARAQTLCLFLLLSLDMYTHMFSYMYV
jgi:hypothetical protein